MDFLHPNREDLERLADQAPSDTFLEDAMKTLDSDDERDRRMFSEAGDQPVLIAPDIASTVRLPNLIPDDWRPHLTEMIFQAVDPMGGDPDGKPPQ